MGLKVDRQLQSTCEQKKNGKSSSHVPGDESSGRARAMKESLTKERRRNHRAWGLRAIPTRNRIWGNRGWVNDREEDKKVVQTGLGKTGKGTRSAVASNLDCGCSRVLQPLASTTAPPNCKSSSSAVFGGRIPSSSCSVFNASFLDTTGTTSPCSCRISSSSSLLLTSKDEAHPRPRHHHTGSSPDIPRTPRITTIAIPTLRSGAAFVAVPVSLHILPL